MDKAIIEKYRKIKQYTKNISISKNAYFFVIDALIASLILTAMIITLMNVNIKQRTQQPELQEALYKTMSFLTETKIMDLSSLYLESINKTQILGTQLEDYSIIDYASYMFIMEHSVENVSQFMGNILSTTTSYGNGMSIYINSTQVFAVNTITNRSINDSDEVLKSEHISLIRVNNTVVAIPVEVIIWR